MQDPPEAWGLPEFPEQLGPRGFKASRVLPAQPDPRVRRRACQVPPVLRDPPEILAPLAQQGLRLRFLVRPEISDRQDRQVQGLRVRLDRRGPSDLQEEVPRGLPEVQGPQVRPEM